MVPDEKGASTSAKLSLGQATSATICNFKPGSNEMDKNIVTAPNHVLTLKVTETPVFVVINN